VLQGSGVISLVLVLNKLIPVFCSSHSGLGSMSVFSLLHCTQHYWFVLAWKVRGWWGSTGELAESCYTV